MAMASSSKKSANLLGKRNPEDDLETNPILKKHKEKSEDKVELLETKSDQANLISEKETVEGLNQTPQLFEAAAVIKKTLFVHYLAYKTKISDIIDFFKDVGQVVRVRLLVNQKCRRVGYGFVEFASANETEKALQKKNGEFLHDHKIFLDVAHKEAAFFPPKYCIDHKVWYKEDYRESLLIEEHGLKTRPSLKKPKMGGFCGKKITFSDNNYLQRESLPIEEDETPPDFVEEVLFVANLSPQTEILHIINFFNYVGKVVSVRLIVNHEGKHVGYGFVEFASSYEAKKALQKKNGEYLHDHKIFLELAKTAPYPPRPKYNLAEKLCYEDYLRRESFLIEEDETMEVLDETPDFVEALAVRKKSLFVTRLSHQTEISHIINFFKDVGEVVHVRLIVSRKGKHVGSGFVEFASANEAKKALEKKNGEYLHDRKIVLEVAKIAPPPKYCIDHKVWYEDYLRQESLLIEEDEAVGGLDETPDFVEEVAAGKKTLFVHYLAYKTKISDFIDFFKDVGQVVRVRLIVNDRSEQVGCGFVEFASAYEAKKALQKKNHEKWGNCKIFLDEAKIAPYPLRPKYNLAEKLWYEDYFRRESLLIEEDDLETKPNLKKPKMGGFCGKKITFADDE